MNFAVSKAQWFLVPPSRYVVTFSPLMDTKEDPQAIIIWDILTGQKKRGFHCESSAHWPIFKLVPQTFVFLLSLFYIPFFAHAVIEYLISNDLCSQMEPRWEVLCKDDHRHSEHLWDSSELTLKIMIKKISCFKVQCAGSIKTIFCFS